MPEQRATSLMENVNILADRLAELRKCLHEQVQHALLLFFLFPGFATNNRAHIEMRSCFLKNTT